MIVKVKIALRSRKTFYTYLLSYILILAVSLFGMYYVVNWRLKSQFQQNYLDQSVGELNDRVEVITGRLLDLNKISHSLGGDIATIMARYDDSPATRIQVTQEMRKYISGNSLVRDVFYLDTGSGTLYSTNLLADVAGDTVTVQVGSVSYALNLKEIASLNGVNHLLRFGEPAVPPLYLYYPMQDGLRYQVLFILEEKELNALLRACLSQTVRAAALVDSDTVFLGGLNEELLEEKLREAPADWQDHHEESPGGLSLHPTVSFNISILAYADMEALDEAVAGAFRNSYYIMILIAAAGLVLTVFAMRITYNPVLRVIKKITGGGRAETDNLQSLVTAFDDTRSEQKLLLEKLENYRLSIQRSMLDSIVQAQGGDDPAVLTRIDRLFDPGQGSCIVVAVIRGCSGALLPQPEIRGYIEGRGSLCTLCFLSEEKDGGLRLLLDFSDSSSFEAKEEDIRGFFAELCSGFSCRAAVSDVSSNPMDVARLYGNADAAARQLADRPQPLFYTDLSREQEDGDGENEGDYPYRVLDSFADCLEEHDFSGAFQALDSLMNAVDRATDQEFYVRCVLIDGISILIGSMNKANIRFERFSETYLQALYLCRSSDYRKTFPQIRGAMGELLELYSQEAENSSIQLSQVRAYILQHAFSSDFSVAALADAFGTSAAYMSFVFKKRTDTNLTDYVWQLRLEEACALLRNTDYPIDKISALIGYDNASSFRRKFKESTGVSPSQFRKSNR